MSPTSYRTAPPRVTGKEPSVYHIPGDKLVISGTVLGHVGSDSLGNRPSTTETVRHASCDQRSRDDSFRLLHPGLQRRAERRPLAPGRRRSVSPDPHRQPPTRPPDVSITAIVFPLKN